MDARTAMHYANVEVLLNQIVKLLQTKGVYAGVYKDTCTCVTPPMPKDEDDKCETCGQYGLYSRKCKAV